MNIEFKYIDDDYFFLEEELDNPDSSDEPIEESNPENSVNEDKASNEESINKEESLKESNKSKSKNSGDGKNDKSNEVADSASSNEDDLDGSSSVNVVKEFDFPNLIGKKIGMTQLFSDDGTVFPATVVEAGPCTVTQIKNSDTDGYNSVQIGFLDKKESKTTKPLLGHFLKSKSSPKKILKEFRVDNSIDNLSLGSNVLVNQFLGKNKLLG